MAYLSPDIILFGLFLALNLFIGLRAGRQVKTVQGFTIGNKDFSTGTIVATILASEMAGFMSYGLQNTYTRGLLFIIPLIGCSLSFLLIGQVLAVHMGEFLSNLSVAEAMGNLYGKVIRIITAISGILLSIGYMTMAFQVMAEVLSFLSGFKGPEVTITAAAIVILYSAFGGIRSVVITDVFQFIVFSIFIPLIALVIWKHLKGPSQVSQVLATNPIFSFKQVIGWNPSFLSALGLMLYFTIPGLSPAVFQRILIARDLKQVKSSFSYAVGADFLVSMSVVFIGILLLAVNPNLDPSGLVNYIVTTYAYPGLKALIAMVITAMAMSTADSFINVAAILAVNDIVKPLKPGWKESMVIVRIFSMIFGVVALLLALHKTDLLELLRLSASLWMPIVTVPLLLAIFGFRSTPRAVLIGMGAGFITVLGWDKLFGNLGLDSLIPGMLANLTFLMGSHYALRQSGGWVGIKDKAPLMAARQARQEAWQNLVRTIKETKIYDYLQQNLPAYDAIYSLFGLYVLGATYACFFTIPDNLVSQYQRLYDIAAHSVLICTAGFLTYPAWPPTFRAKWFITYAWPAGMGYILFVVGTQLVLMSGFHQVQTMIFLVNLILAAMLLSWPLMLSLAAGGIALGCFVFKQYYGPIHLPPMIGQVNFIYGTLLGVCFLIALFRFKQKQARLQAQNAYLTNAYAGLREELAQLVGCSEELLRELNYDDLKLLVQTIAAYMQQAIYRVTSYVKLSVQEITIDTMLQEVRNTIELKNLTPMPELLIEKHTSVSKIAVDKGKVCQLLVNSIEYIHQHNTFKKPIRIILEDATLGHHIGYMETYSKDIPTLKITITQSDRITSTLKMYNTFAQNVLDQTLALRKNGMGWHKLIVENARIIDAHYGYGDIDETGTQVYVIATNVREVRSKVMALFQEPAVANPDALQDPVESQV